MTSYTAPAFVRDIDESWRDRAGKPKFQPQRAVDALH